MHRCMHREERLFSRCFVVGVFADELNLRRDVPGVWRAAGTPQLAGSATLAERTEGASIQRRIAVAHASFRTPAPSRTSMRLPLRVLAALLGVLARGPALDAQRAPSRDFRVTLLGTGSP